VGLGGEIHDDPALGLFGRGLDDLVEPMTAGAAKPE
jgi:hypothetical protein